MFMFYDNLILYEHTDTHTNRFTVIELFLSEFDKKHGKITKNLPFRKN